VYISAISTQGRGAGQGTYTNMYVLSYNEGADAITKSVFEQMVATVEFMTNEPDPVVRGQFKRDALRLTIAGTIIAAIENRGSCPSLRGGTFVSGRTTSAWPSWRGLFSSELGVGPLSVDPLNTFNGCPSGYDPATCWNSSILDFACPDGSHVMQYLFTAPDACKVGFNMEVKGVTWQGSPLIVTPNSDQCASSVVCVQISGRSGLMRSLCPSVSALSAL